MITTLAHRYTLLRHWALLTAWFGANSVRQEMIAEPQRHAQPQLTQPALVRIRIRTRSPFEVRGALYVPATATHDPNPMETSRIHLFRSGQPLPQTDLLPPYFGFVRGWIELGDARHTHDRRGDAHDQHELWHVRRILRTTITRELVALADYQPELFRRFWLEHGHYFERHDLLAQLLILDVLNA